MHYSRSTRGGMKASISSSRKSSATRRGASGCTAAIVNVVVMYVFPPHAAPLAPKLSLMSLGLRWKYYDAVEQLGPLPPRLKAPMWRSPESSPSKKPVCISFSDGGHDESENIAIKQQHKNAISRHRDQWEFWFLYIIFHLTTTIFVFAFSTSLRCSVTVRSSFLVNNTFGQLSKCASISRDSLFPVLFLEVRSALLLQLLRIT